MVGYTHVPADGLELAKPSALYDPSNRMLARVFAGEPLFPVGKFASSGWLKVRLCQP